MTAFFRDRSGGVAIYTAVFAVLGVSAGAVAIDFGRLQLVRTQMQHTADAAALAGVIHLNGQEGALARAENVAHNAMVQKSSVAATTGDQIAVAEVKFYSTYGATPVETTDDLDAQLIEVVLATRTAKNMFAPVLAKIATQGGSATQTLNARAVAGVRPYICHAPPLMMCDLTEDDPTLDPMDPANVGRMVVLKEPQGGGYWAPGNFGLLSLPDGSSGAKDIEAALAAIAPQDCYQIDVLTATGSKTDKIKEGINVRFDTSTVSQPPAPNVISYDRDLDVIADDTVKMGSGVWDLSAYWTAKHGGAPPGLLSGATRYQAYLYELGEEFGRFGRQTIYPVPADPTTMPPGYSVVSPPGPDIPVDAANPNDPNYDGVPQNTPASNGPARRLLEVALLQCVADDVHGHHAYPTYGQYVEIFLTEEVNGAPEAAIYGEIVRPLSSVNDPEFHSNAALVK